MLSGVFQLQEAQARQVMTPFHAVVMVDEQRRRADALAALPRLRAHAAGRHRGERPDRVVGVAHSNSTRAARARRAGDDAGGRGRRSRR